MAAKYTANPGILAASIDAVDLAAAIGAGTEFALSIPSQGTPSIAWQTSFSGGNPASITVLLQASNDGTNWATIDTSTSITGEIRVVTGSYRFLRANNSAVTVGAGILLTVSFVYSNSIISSALPDLQLFNATGLNLPTTGIVEQALKTVTVPAGALLGAFASVEIVGSWFGAANANRKSPRIRFGTIAGPSQGFANDTTSGDVYTYKDELWARTSAILDGVGISGQVTGSTFVFAQTVTGLTLTSAFDIIFTGETLDAAGDLTLNAVKVVLHRKQL